MKNNFKFILNILFYNFLHFLEVNGSNLLVENVGLLDFFKNDIVMIFFVQVRDHEPESRPYYAHFEPIQCCETISKVEKDCESMKLIGGYLEVKPIEESINFTLFYPTTYGYNRHGTCLIRISYGSGLHKQLTQEIVFNTVIRPHVIPKGLGHFYDPTKLKPCRSLDEDPFTFCTPVNCMNKYSGMRNIYNLNTASCEKAAICTDELVFDLVNNKCRKLSPITKEDLQEFDNLSKMRSKENLFQGICYKGKIEMGACICDEGWKTVRKDDSTVESIIFCNMPTSENIFTTQSIKTVNRYEIICSFILTALILLIIFLVNRKYENQSRIIPENHPNISYYRVVSDD